MKGLKAKLNVLQAQAYLTQTGEPETWKEMMDSPEVHEWHKAIEAEKASLEKMGVFELVSEAPKRPIQSKWVFKKKLKADGLLKDSKQD